jgi:hypothetical protein
VFYNNSNSDSHRVHFRTIRGANNITHYQGDTGMSEPSAMSEEQRDQFFFMSIVQNFQQLAWGGLGKIANPDQSEPKVDIEQARWAIDMLAMLQRRTQGNLSPEEERDLQQVMYTLQMNFVEEQQNQGGATSEPSEAPQAPESTDESTPSDDAGTESPEEASENGGSQDSQ